MNTLSWGDNTVKLTSHLPEKGSTLKRKTVTSNGRQYFPFTVDSVLEGRRHVVKLTGIHKCVTLRDNGGNGKATYLPSVLFVAALLYLSVFPFGVGVLMWI